MVRASSEAKSGKLCGPSTKSMIALAFCWLTPGVMSTSSRRRTSCGMTHGELHGRHPAHRHADDEPRVGRELLDHHGDVVGHVLRGVAAVVAPAGMAVAGKVDGQRRQVRSERQDHRVPGVGVLRAAVEEHDLRARRTPDQRADDSPAVHGDLGAPYARWPGQRPGRTRRRSRETGRTRRRRCAPSAPSFQVRRTGLQCSASPWLRRRAAATRAAPRPRRRPARRPLRQRQRALPPPPARRPPRRPPRPPRVRRRAAR